MNASDRLLDLFTIRTLLLLRIASGENIRINKEYDAIAADIQRQLRGPELSTYKGKRLDKAIAELKKRILVKPPKIGELAKTEARYTVQSLIQVGINAVLPPDDVVERVANSSLVQGATIKQWWEKLNDTTAFDLERAIKNGVLLGQTNREIAKNIVGNGTDKGPEALSKARRDAMAVTRTGVQTIANEARISVYDENSDIIKAVQWVSTLDSRTTDICMARSGKTWKFPGFKPIGHEIPWNGGPPAHWMCRSTSIPITKTFAEIDGEDAVTPDITPTTRSSMDGQVAADLSFDDFLRGKPKAFADEMLGKGRAELWREGKITLSDLLSARGTPLTLEQLKSKYGGVTKFKADDTPTPAPIPARKVNAPAINPDVKADTIVVVPRKQVQKALTEQFAASALDPRYGIENRIVFGGIRPADLGKSNLSTGFTDEAMSMISAIKPELDDLATRFNVPQLRGFKTSTASIGSMGDGIMTLHPEYFSGYATNVGARVGASRLAELETQTTVLREQIGGLRQRLSDINQQLSATARNSEEYSALWVEKSAVIKDYNKLANDINKNAKVIQLTKRNEVPASTWKPGDEPDKRPHGAEYYMDDGVDRARAVLYHEFAHHVHQMYAKIGPRSAELPPIERRLRQIWGQKGKGDRALQATKYSTTNEKEWFAENFALYMMGKRDLVDADIIKLIEELLDEQANR